MARTDAHLLRVHLDAASLCPVIDFGVAAVLNAGTLQSGQWF